MTLRIAVSHRGNIYRCLQAGDLRERLEICRFFVQGLGTVVLSRRDGRVLLVQPVSDEMAALLDEVADRLFECWQLVLS